MTTSFADDFKLGQAASILEDRNKIQNDFEILKNLSNKVTFYMIL